VDLLYGKGSEVQGSAFRVIWGKPKKLIINPQISQIAQIKMTVCWRLRNLPDSILLPGI
jgi:hypothetical protein